MHRIKTYNQIAEQGLERFPSTRFQVGADTYDADAILLRSHKLTVAELGNRLKAVARAGAGVNNVPVADCTERGIVVFNTPGANANAVKELVLSGMLLGSRGIVAGMRYIDTLSDITDHAELNTLLEAEKKRFAGNELKGKTLGIIGLGAIGSLVAGMAIDLGMKVLGYDPALSVDAAWRLPNQVQKIENVSALLANSDYVSLHLPVLESTRGLINADMVGHMKPGLCLLNFSRDEIVDTPAIVTGLEAGALRMYISDFPRHELIGRDDVILMPHIGASTEEAEENCAIMAAEQLKDFLDNGNIRNSVNFPALSLDRVQGAASGTRLAISNKNVPGMLGKILSILAEQDINVVDMINKSRDDIAYNLIDLASPPAAAAIDAIASTDDVIKVMVL
ncbi:MAG: 3-phosphoglycerate dehydrogenase family protein [Pseudohongiella sp.]|nr:3-phosphoglycerate dehydrogenase family protein [Pseudohongiella sp.]MDO9518654.1 3-phosphoglycerate dehydrogenase family protein [Pseudohongiella sp.]MDP2128427.1 3-phosphoglycerate dehydrogenase family protein [Pseudohongiella sp.]